MTLVHWLEASWRDVALFAAIWAALAFILVPLFTRAMGRLAPIEPPAGGEDPAAHPPSALDSPLPGPADVVWCITGYKCGCQRTISVDGKPIGWKWCTPHNPWRAWEKQLRETP